MDLQLLGPVEATVDGRPVPLGATKQRAVLAMLALRANRTVSIDSLIEGLWGEEPPASAPKMVQLYVSQLRRLLDGDGAEIVTRGRGYELRARRRRVDAARFERLVAEAGRAEAGRTAAREALALWRGDALADVADEPFAARRDPPARGAAAARGRAGDRRRPRGRPPSRARRRARGAGRRAPAARAAARRSACSRCIAPAARPRRWRPTGTRARRSSSEIGVEPGARAARGCTTRSCARTPPRSTCPPPHRRPRRPPSLGRRARRRLRPSAPGRRCARPSPRRSRCSPASRSSP